MSINVILPLQITFIFQQKLLSFKIHYSLHHPHTCSSKIDVTTSQVIRIPLFETHVPTHNSPQSQGGPELHCFGIAYE
jgi:hypothetical protein